MRKSRLSRYKQARSTLLPGRRRARRLKVKLVGMHHNTAANFCHRLREIIACELGKGLTNCFAGEIEVDESCFDGRRKGKRGRGAAGKVPVFGLLKRGGKVCVKVIPDACSRTLAPIMKGRIMPDSNELDPGIHRTHRRAHGVASSLTKESIL